MAYSTLGKALTRNGSLVTGKSEIGQGLGPISEIYANRGGAKLTGLLEAFRLIFGLLAQLVEHSTVNRRAIGSSPIQAAICEQIATAVTGRGAVYKYLFPPTPDSSMGRAARGACVCCRFESYSGGY